MKKNFFASFTFSVGGNRQKNTCNNLFLGQFNLKDFLPHFQYQNIKSKFSEEMDHSSWVIRDPSLHPLFSHQATQIQFFFLPLALTARGNFRACFYYLLMVFVLWLQHYFGQGFTTMTSYPQMVTSGTGITHQKSTPIRGSHLSSSHLSPHVLQSIPAP